ncbi:alpha-1,3-mannosyl-glycoprotein 4-beta-N-acetylglucosaminyltransferase-like protein MGAT4D [Tupaia chinensis]|uniref:alpha-1,3-mannosyl-glycoprotein 4-beta-N-acetylglucosaminyltransferase-like protein MGAT4D n=1 Tax=Tupaia chinensis TaxID=246437 RepID=UPI0003C8DA61|nr:alpha-1,3-mannosyl-glycoprotein 4-beta-N-acetylglucosaminyltransferase-like protein MGAT4D [Tupaia chinensis]
MKTKHVNLLISITTIMLFNFSCFCIWRMTRINNRLTNCRNHMLEFKENMIHLKKKTEKNHQDLRKVLNKIKYPELENVLRSSVLALVSWDLQKSVEKEVEAFRKNETVPNNTFEDLKIFFPHLKKEGRLYPDVILAKEKTGVSFALGISIANRRSHSYLMQTLSTVVSGMTPAEEKDSVVIVSVADSNEDYLYSIVDMIAQKFKMQVMSGSLEIISIPAFFYPNTSYVKKSTENSQNLESWQVKQVLDFCILMLYAQPKARYYLQLEDGVIAKKNYFTTIKNFMDDISSSNWFYIEFSVLGFIGKLLRSKDLLDFVRFSLMFYKEKPIDLLLNDFFQIKMCNPGEAIENCAQRKKQICIRYKHSLFQHVGIYPPFPEKNNIAK